MPSLRSSRKSSFSTVATNTTTSTTTSTADADDNADDDGDDDVADEDEDDVGRRKLERTNTGSSLTNAIKRFSFSVRSRSQTAPVTPTGMSVTASREISPKRGGKAE